MLEDFVDPILGGASDWLRSVAAGKAQEIVEQLLDAALAAWAKESHHRFSDDEDCCTVAIFAAAQRAQSSDAQYVLVAIHFQEASPTPMMLAGAAHPNSANRPDLRFSIGNRSLPIEAKRLSAKGPLPRKYVTEGVKRFESGYYPVPSGCSGLMLAYLTEPPASAAVAAVNRHITRELPDHKALQLVRTSPIADSYESKTSGGLQVIHRLVTLT